MRATVSHFEIPAQDLDRAARFYREVFGWTVEPLPWEHPYFKVRCAAEGSKEGIDGGLVPASEGFDRPLLVIHVSGASPEVWTGRIVEHGGRIERQPAPVGDFGWFARFFDPEGNLLGLWGSLVP